MNFKLVIVDPCIHCGESTAMGYGNFVNRIPAENGWACPNCAGFVCETHRLDKHYYNIGYNHALSNVRYIIESLQLYNKPDKEIVETIYNLKEKN